MTEKQVVTIKDVSALVTRVSECWILLPQGTVATECTKRQQDLLQLIADDNETNVESLHMLGSETVLTPRARGLYNMLCKWLSNRHSAFETFLKGHEQ